MAPRVKVCCISSLEEAQLAVWHGVNALGFVSRMPSGPGVIDEELIGCIAAQVPPGVSTFLLTAATQADEIVVQQRRCRVDTVQLVDRVIPPVHAALRAALPGVRLVQVVHVTGPESVAEAVHASAGVDAILLDSGNPSLAVKELGGTGRVHDWALSRCICDQVNVPVFLAGGLCAENVGDALSSVGPYGVDVCSCVRTEGRLDARKLALFMRAVSAGPAPLTSVGKSLPGT